jgi:hypothetical protein
MSSLGSEVLNGVCLVSADPIQRFGQHAVELSSLERLDAWPEGHTRARNLRVRVGVDELLFLASQPLAAIMLGRHQDELASAVPRDLDGSR